MEEGLALIRHCGEPEQWLAVLVTIDDDMSPQASVVNAGILRHPVTGATCLGVVASGGARKLANLRRRARATLVFRHGWEWVSVTGDTELVGPDDSAPGIDAAARRQLLRDIFADAGGTHDDLDEYDRVMAAEGRTAILVAPERIVSN
ncbi:MAG: pyridoxamine 5-phosphate oxidase [Actinomycetia bacterium]|nr:pyridoxamine 5-phosphate oxidase [Actinomycetes bacterium]